VINLRDDRVRIDRTAGCGRVQEYSGLVVSGLTFSIVAFSAPIR